MRYAIRWFKCKLKPPKKLPPVVLNLMITGGNFFAAVKSFDASIAISGNFVSNAKNSIVLQNPWVAKILVNKQGVRASSNLSLQK